MHHIIRKIKENGAWAVDRAENTGGFNQRLSTEEDSHKEWA